jgi:hypothetical protein
MTYDIEIHIGEVCDLETKITTPLKRIPISKEQKEIVEFFADVIKDENSQNIYKINKCEFRISEMLQQKKTILSKEDKDAIHDTLFQLDIIGINDDNKVEVYYNLLPKLIIEKGLEFGFSDTEVKDKMHEFFKTLKQ